MTRETDFLKGAQLVVEAMLQSSNFLFRLDETADPKLKPYVTASRLSYAIWDTMPDAELLAVAARGELATPQSVEKAARRMLDQPRAREALDEFVGQWLRFDRILTASKDRRKFPQFTRETAVAMTEEARTFVGDLVWNDRNFMELFTANYGFVNADLAPIYKVAAPAKEFDRVAFPAGSDTGRCTRSGPIPCADGEARRLVSYRARPVRPGAVSLPARSRSAGRRQYQPAAGYRGQAPDQPRSHVRTRHQPELRDVP